MLFLLSFAKKEQSTNRLFRLLGFFGGGGTALQQSARINSWMGVRRREKPCCLRFHFYSLTKVKETCVMSRSLFLGKWISRSISLGLCFQKFGQPIQERYMEHEERPKVLNELGKKIQLLMKAVEAYKNKVEAWNDLWLFEFDYRIFLCICSKRKKNFLGLNF